MLIFSQRLVNVVLKEIEGEDQPACRPKIDWLHTNLSQSNSEPDQVNFPSDTGGQKKIPNFR
jgi:hypothetical protein